MEIMSAFVGTSNTIQTRLHGVAVLVRGTGFRSLCCEENSLLREFSLTTCK